MLEVMLTQVDDPEYFVQYTDYDFISFPGNTIGASSFCTCTLCAVDRHVLSAVVSQISTQYIYLYAVKYYNKHMLMHGLRTTLQKVLQHTVFALGHILFSLL